MKPTPPLDLELLISQTEALTWDDIVLEPAIETATIISNHALVGKLVSSKPLNKHTFHTTIKSVWSFILGLHIEDLGPNTFPFTFPTSQDNDRVYNQRPWNFKGFHMILKEWLPGQSLQEIDLKFSAYWVEVT